MELRQLNIFQAIAQSGSFTRAAERLGYVQSNVSAHIQALEQELGVQLFDRVGRNVRLTAAGRRLAEYANRILALSEEAREVVSAPLNSELVLSAPETLCTHRLPQLLRAAREHLPQTRLVFRPVATPQLRNLVRSGELDLVFTLEIPSQSSGLCSEVLAQEPVVVVVAPEHRLAHASSVSASDLIDEAALLTESGCAYRNLFEQAMRAAGAPSINALEFSSVEAIKQCVIADMGFAVLPLITVSREVQRGELAILPWHGPNLAVATHLVWSELRWHPPAFFRFLDLSRSVLGSEIVVSDVR